MSENQKDWKKFKEQIESEIDMDALDEQADSEESEKKAGLDHPSYKALEESLTLAEQKAHENWEKAIRAVAELDNVRRRAERDVANAHRFGLEKFIHALLPVVDSIDQGIQAAGENANHGGMLEGLKLTHKLFIDALEKFDVKLLDPLGELFNPQEHEAMSMVEVPGTPANTIVTVFQKGYLLNDRVIRPARVIVAKNTD